MLIYIYYIIVNTTIICSAQKGVRLFFITRTHSHNPSTVSKMRNSNKEAVLVILVLLYDVPHKPMTNSAYKCVLHAPVYRHLNVTITYFCKPHLLKGINNCMIYQSVVRY